jgi:hypothetical protein
VFQVRLQKKPLQPVIKIQRHDFRPLEDKLLFSVFRVILSKILLQSLIYFRNTQKLNFRKNVSNEASEA